MEMFLQDKPIVVDVIKQPPITQEITMADVVVGAVGLTGVIMICALLAGLIAGGIFIWMRKVRERQSSEPPGLRGPTG
jgi:hypothetical protein